MASMFMTRLAVAALTLSLVHAQTTIPDYWNGYGTNSFYFHNRCKYGVLDGMFVQD